MATLFPTFSSSERKASVCGELSKHWGDGGMLCSKGEPPSLLQVNKQQLRSKWGKAFWHRGKKRNDRGIGGNLTGVTKGTETGLQGESLPRAREQYKIVYIHWTWQLYR